MIRRRERMMVKRPFFNNKDENEFYGQHKWKEICCDPHDLNNYAAPEQNLDISKDNAIIREARQKARHELFKRLLGLVDELFTEHQKKVFFLMRKGKTYQEIGAILHENYSSPRSAYTSIAYAIKGIKSKKHGKHHGGIERKLKKLCLRDSMCQQILKDLKALEKDNVDIAITYLKQFDDWYITYDEARDRDPIY